jgi:1-acyl-sn-glycerol-3-phosphate acyltransferase
VPRRTSILLVSNHRTMFDSFLVAGLTFFPEGLLYPSLAPYHAAAKENYFRWYHLGIFRLLRCIPVRAGRKDLEAMNAIKEALANGNVHLFYQGRRSQDLDEARDGIGYIVYNARPTVVPVYFSGIERVFGRKWEIRSLFRRIHLIYGRSIDFVDLYSLPNTKDTWAQITQRVVQNVKTLARDVGDEPA